MQRLKAFGIKLIGIGIITSVIFGIFGNANLGNLLLITVVIATLSYLGDLFILPRVNKLFAVIADFALYFVLYYFLGSIIIDEPTSLLLVALTTSYLAGIGEALFHLYMIDYVFNDRYVNPFPGRYQTEFAQETELKSVSDEEKSLGKDGKK